MRVRLVLPVLLLTATVLVACSSEPEPEQDKTPEQQVGAVLEGSVTLYGGGRELPVFVPDGQVGLSVGRPFHSLPASEWTGVEDTVAAPGAAFVGVQWEGDGGFGTELNAIMTGAELPTYGDPDRTPAGLTLVAGDQRIPLPGSDALGRIGDGGVFYVVVPDDVEPTVEVEFDGVVQTAGLDDPGREPTGPAAALEPISEGATGGTETEADCPFQGSADQGLQVTYFCGVREAWSVPYVKGLGWAREGTTWLVADASTAFDVDGFLEGDRYVARYDSTLTSWSATVDGVAPATRLTSRNAPTGDESQRLVWSVPVSDTYPLRFDTTYQLTRRGDGGGSSAAATVTQDESGQVELRPDAAG